MKADKLLNENKYKYQMISTPLEISTNCGMSLLVEIVEFDRVKDFLVKNNFIFTVFER